MKKIYFLFFFFFLVISSKGVVHAQCLTDSHGPFEDDAWLSCTLSAPPTGAASESHWLMYDFGQLYTLDSLHVWNYNVWGHTESGVKRMQIWYSFDGENWTDGGEVQLDKAPGSWNYDTPQILALPGITAQFLCLTVLETYDAMGSCAGLSELKITAQEFSSSTSDLDDVLSGIKLSPNPAASFLNIESIEKDVVIDKLQIYSSLGHLVKVVNEINSSRQSIDLSMLTDGMYTLVIQSGDRYIQKPFVKISG